jgi:multidrug efflux pump subunit AcrB
VSAAAFALRHGRGILFLVVMSAAGGLLVGRGLPSGVYPEVTFLREQVVATLPGAPGATVLAGVTRPLEAALSSIPGVERVRSRTIRAAVELSLFFASDTDMVQAHSLVLARLAELQAELPPQTQTVAERVLPSSFPILSLNVEGPYPATQLDELARYTVRPALAGLPGVGVVSVQSSDVPEIEVLLDREKLEAARLTVPDVVDRLRSANHVQAVARLTKEHELALGIVTGELRSTAEIGELVVGGTSAAPLRIQELGRVADGVAPRTSIIRVDGKPGAIINITRRLGGDTVALDRAVRERLAELQPSLPPGMIIKPVYEQAAFVEEGVASVRDSVLFGAVLAVFVLALFLRDWRATVLAALSLPLTLASSLLVMKALGQTLNLMSLGGLAVSVGLVIDDAVVVIEAVHKYLEAGLPPSEAARRGTDDLFWPVVGTTATTVVVFLPLGLLSGVAGQFFAALSLSLAAAVVLSLPVALMVLPAVAGTFLRPVKHKTGGNKLADFYARAVTKALGRRSVVLGIALVLIAIGGWAGTTLATDFLPEADEGGYVIDYFAPVGASLEETDQLASRIEEVLRKTPEVDGFSRRLGAELGPPTATLSSRGDIAVRLKTNRSRDFEEISAEQRAQIAQAVPGLRVEFVQVLADMLGDLEGSPEPIEVRVFGPDPVVLRRLALEGTGKIEKVPGIVDLFNGDEGCAPEIDVRVDPLASGRQGLDATKISDQISTALLGEVATQLRRPEHLIDVRVRLAGMSDLMGPEVLDQLRVRGADGSRLPLRSVASIGPTCPAAVLLRDNQRNMVHITARLSGTSLGAASSAVRAKLADWRLPPGYTWQLAGLADQQRTSFLALLVALVVAMAAVLSVLLFQLRSWRRSLAVLAGTPLALTGGVLTLAITRVPMNVSSLMGAILLIGLVVKNGILLLDHALAAEEAGATSFDALVEAARARLRPIVMTTLATLVALLPLVFGLGAGSALHRPLALTVVGGLAFSTVATLFVVPALALRRRRDSDSVP